MSDHFVIHRDGHSFQMTISLFIEYSVLRNGHCRIMMTGARSDANEHFSYSSSLQVVTLWYRAPEVLLGGQRYCMGVDQVIFSFIFKYFSRNTNTSTWANSETQYGYAPIILSRNYIPDQVMVCLFSSGRSAASLLRWQRRSLSSRETPRLMNYSESSGISPVHSVFHHSFPLQNNGHSDWGWMAGCDCLPRVQGLFPRMENQ